MTELKTLKDFERNECHGEQRCYCDIHSVANVEDLKSEAVKWVKYIRKLGLDEMIWCEFFNLTEADLQEKK